MNKTAILLSTRERAKILETKLNKIKILFNLGEANLGFPLIKCVGYVVARITSVNPVFNVVSCAVSHKQLLSADLAFLKTHLCCGFLMR